MILIFNDFQFYECGLVSPCLVIHQLVCVQQFIQSPAEPIFHKFNQYIKKLHKRMHEIQYHSIALNITTLRAELGIKFPCSLCFHVISCNYPQQKSSTQFYQLRSGQCIINQQLSITISLPSQGRAPQLKFDILVFMKFSQSRIPAGKGSFSVRTQQLLNSKEPKQIQLKIDRCPDKNAKLFLEYETKIPQKQNKVINILKQSGTEHAYNDLITNKKTDGPLYKPFLANIQSLKEVYQARTQVMEQQIHKLYHQVSSHKNQLRASQRKARNLQWSLKTTRYKLLKIQEKYNESEQQNLELLKIMNVLSSRDCNTGLIVNKQQGQIHQSVAEQQNEEKNEERCEGGNEQEDQDEGELQELDQREDQQPDHRENKDLDKVQDRNERDKGEEDYEGDKQDKGSDNNKQNSKENTVEHKYEKLWEERVMMHSQEKSRLVDELDELTEINDYLISQCQALKIQISKLKPTEEQDTQIVRQINGEEAAKEVSVERRGQREEIAMLQSFKQCLIVSNRRDGGNDCNLNVQLEKSINNQLELQGSKLQVVPTIQIDNLQQTVKDIMKQYAKLQQQNQILINKFEHNYQEFEHLRTMMQIDNKEESQLKSIAEQLWGKVNTKLQILWDHNSPPKTHKKTSNKISRTQYCKKELNSQKQVIDQLKFLLQQLNIEIQGQSAHNLDKHSFYNCIPNNNQEMEQQMDRLQELNSQLKTELQNQQKQCGLYRDQCTNLKQCLLNKQLQIMDRQQEIRQKQQAIKKLSASVKVLTKMRKQAILGRGMGQYQEPGIPEKRKLIVFPKIKSGLLQATEMLFTNNKANPVYPTTLRVQPYNYYGASPVQSLEQLIETID